MAPSRGQQDHRDGLTPRAGGDVADPAVGQPRLPTDRVALGRGVGAAAAEQVQPAGRSSNPGVDGPSGCQDPWPDDRTPPGSAYSWQEWCDAMDDGCGGHHVVFEMRSARESALVRMPRDPAGDAFDCFVFDGCLLLAPMARTSHPGAVCGELSLRGTGFPWTYRVVRPQSHRLDRGFLFGARVAVEIRSDELPGEPGLHDQPASRDASRHGA